MKLKRMHLSLILFSFFLVFIFCGKAPQLKADHVFQLGELNPQTERLGVFNSFKHHLLVIAITKKNSSPFDCQPNRYIFYNYKKETYFEILAGNLKINSDYSQLIKTRIHTMVGSAPQETSDWKMDVQDLLSRMNISSSTMEKGKMAGADGTIFCWQQPEIVNLKTRFEKPFPFLAANLCKFAWCSELYWTGSNQVRFWVQINPKELHLIQLDTQSGAYQYKKKSSTFLKKKFVQLNAPRDNLVTEKNLDDGSFTVSSHAKRSVKLLWKKQKNGKIKIQLIRAKKNSIAGKRTRNKIKVLLKEKKIAEAYQLLKFGFWLSPDDKEMKMERLRVYASLLMTDQFITSLKEDFSDDQRFDACKQLHVDQSLKNLWKQKSFINLFKQTCP
jgi:hypothetical protein